MGEIIHVSGSLTRCAYIRVIDLRSVEDRAIGCQKQEGMPSRNCALTASKLAPVYF